MQTGEQEKNQPTREETLDAIALLRSMCGMLHEQYEAAGGVDRVIAELDADEIIP